MASISSDAPDSERLFIITGASRGIGKAITLALVDSKVFMEGKVTFILTSTKMNDLEAAKLNLEEAIANTGKSSENVSVYTHPIDFGDPEGIETNIKMLMQMARPLRTRWDHVCLIMNHGSLGGLKFVEDIHNNIPQLVNAIQVNVTSCIVLASMVLKHYSENAGRLDIVNISSLAALQPFESWGVYCIGKSARDMLIQTIALEAEQIPELSKNRNCEIKALNYAPGPVDTDMQAEIRSTANVPSQREYYTNMANTGKLVTPAGTSQKLVSILEQNTYKNGSHLDFFD